jgi:hypothetical protein
MKLKLSALVVLISTASALLAAPLGQTTAVHVQPDALAPVVTYLKAGSEPTLSPDSVANTPAGWMAVELQGPFEAYVLNKDLTKALDVVPGAPLTLEPKAGAGVLTKSVASDKVTITGLYGKWTQIRLDRKLVGYIAVSAIPGYLPPIATTPASTGGSPAPLSPPPSSAVAYGSGDPPSSGPSNLAPGNPALAQRVAAEVVVWSERGVGSVAADLLTSSGSGLDPDISLAAARQQLPRIAAARRLPPDRLESLLERHSHRPLLGLARPPLVNVLAFNLALDELVP